MIRVVLSGSRSFGAAVLDSLLARADVTVVAVASPPWRDTKLPGYADDQPDLLAAAARRSRIPWIDADQLRAATVPAATDLIVCAHSHAFIGAATRRACRLGAIGYHPSLLPRHRGRDAVEWTIRMRDPVAGGSVYWLTDRVDGGPVAARDWTFVAPDDTASTLWSRALFPMGVRLLNAALDDITSGILVQEEQDEAYATWEPSIGRPPLYRPELRELGTPAGYTVRGKVNAH